MQGGELPEVGLVHVDVEALRLVDEAAAVHRHVHERPLLDLPHRPEQRAAAEELQRSDREERKGTEREGKEREEKGREYLYMALRWSGTSEMLRTEPSS